MFYMQKQPPRGVLSKKCSENMQQIYRKTRGGSKAAATSKMERFVIIVNDFQPLTIITKRSILDVAADPPLKTPMAKCNFNKVAKHLY